MINQSIVLLSPLFPQLPKILNITNHPFIMITYIQFLITASVCSFGITASEQEKENQYKEKNSVIRAKKTATIKHKLHLHIIDTSKID